MTSPLQALFFMAITLAPPGTHHVIVSGGTECYSWDKGDQVDGVDTWVYDWADVDPKAELLTNDIVPENYSGAERRTVDYTHRDAKDQSTLRFDPAHQLEKTPEGYVYVVRPGSPNQKFYSFVYQ